MNAVARVGGNAVVAGRGDLIRGGRGREGRGRRSALRVGGLSLSALREAPIPSLAARSHAFGNWNRRPLSPIAPSPTVTGCPPPARGTVHQGARGP